MNLCSRNELHRPAQAKRLWSRACVDEGAQWINAMRTERTNRRNRIAPAQGSSKRKSNAAPAIAPILDAVNHLLAGQHPVMLPRQGIDLLFDSGVVARCRTCGLSWTVKPTQFSSIAWWSCPSGCRPPDVTHRDAALHEQSDE